jgi:hypothetical protein
MATSTGSSDLLERAPDNAMCHFFYRHKNTPISFLESNKSLW